jgi:hypothetical protein
VAKTATLQLEAVHNFPAVAVDLFVVLLAAVEAMQRIEVVEVVYRLVGCLLRLDAVEGVREVDVEAEE